jgi:hypothetical protein
MINVVKQLYRYTTDIRACHKVVVLMRNNAGEGKSKEIQEFFKSKGVLNHFSSHHELWQNWAAE